MITPKTASNHIEHIYTKIDASSRVAASLCTTEHRPTLKGEAIASTAATIQVADPRRQVLLVIMAQPTTVVRSEDAGVRELRQGLIADAKAGVLEIGAGTG